MGTTEYELVAGIETHVQLDTKTKLFCGCPVRFGEPPNTRTCPVCLGLPGALPVLNRKAYELAVRAALALGCDIAPFTRFDRKHYHYPDLPKSFQTSQFDRPFSEGGGITLDSGRTIRLTRVHMEEDAGKLIHEENGKRSFVDLNRTGTPLIEIVTEPDLRSPEETVEYLTELRKIVRAVGASECDMEKGELRCDLNLSIRPKGSETLGVKTEVKNLNSFRFAREALEYEYKRQIGVVEKGGEITQETRLFDPASGRTRVMRTKEDAHDYRYFPCPDLPPVTISKEEVERIRESLPELPRARRDRYVKELGLSEYDATVLTNDNYLANFFEKCTGHYNNPKKVANWVSNKLAMTIKDKGIQVSNIEESLIPSHFGELVEMVDTKVVTASGAGEILSKMFGSSLPPKQLAKEMNLFQISDEGALDGIVDKVISENEKIVADFKAGKDAAIKALIGRVMKETRGRANPQQAESLLRSRLS